MDLWIGVVTDELDELNELNAIVSGLPQWIDSGSGYMLRPSAIAHFLYENADCDTLQRMCCTADKFVKGEKIFLIGHILHSTCPPSVYFWIMPYGDLCAYFRDRGDNSSYSKDVLVKMLINHLSTVY